MTQQDSHVCVCCVNEITIWVKFVQSNRFYCFVCLKLKTSTIVMRNWGFPRSPRHAFQLHSLPASPPGLLRIGHALSRLVSRPTRWRSRCHAVTSRGLVTPSSLVTLTVTLYMSRHTVQSRCVTSHSLYGLRLRVTYTDPILSRYVTPCHAGSVYESGNAVVARQLLAEKRTFFTFYMTVEELTYVVCLVNKEQTYPL